MKRSATIAFCCLLLCPAEATPQVGTAFTYQGKLVDGGIPASGNHDLEIKLFNAPAAGGQIGATLTLEDVAVLDGLFTVGLDFGASAFSGNKRWLEISVRPGASAGAFTLLTPRQELTPTPNAVFSASAAAVTGTVGVTNGGTGQTTLTANGVLFGQGASAVGAVVGASGQVLTGTAGAPAWNDSLSLNGNLALVSPSTATAGNILKGGNPFIHNFGTNNTFLGETAGNFTMTATANTALGTQTLQANTTGFSNTASGAFALRSNTTGSANTAIGEGALRFNTTGSGNTVVGQHALLLGTTVNSNTAIGGQALQNATGGGNIALGHNAGLNRTTGNFSIDIGNPGVAAEGNTIRIGAAANHTRAFVSGIRGVTTGINDAIGVVIDSAGQLGTAPAPTPTNFSGALGGEVTGTQGATVVSNAVSTNTASAIVRRDGGGSFSAGSATLAGNLTLVNPSTAAAGNILKGANRFIHNFGTNNTFVGENAGNLNPALTGGSNTALGFQALISNTTGNGNTASGVNALFFNTDGIDNTANGKQALQSNTDGSNNTAIGVSALFANTTGSGNTATGERALLTNTTGFSNTAIGRSALRLNTDGTLNAAAGAGALQANSTGSSNTAMGAGALQNNTTSSNNTATGQAALFDNTTGFGNTASGANALNNNTTGSGNIALGSGAGLNLTTGNNNIVIGNFGLAGEGSTIRIGTPGTQTRAFVSGIRGVTTGVADAIGVVIDSQGQLGTAPAAVPVSFSGNLVGEVTGTQGATAVSNAVSTNTVNAIVRRDVAGSFSATSALLAGNVFLENSTAGAGNILKNGNRFLHNFGGNNTFLGVNAGNLNPALTGSNNVGVGFQALLSLTSGLQNTAMGANALQSNTTGNTNTATGMFALRLNSAGDNNTATGANALPNNATGSSNTATGAIALLNNTTGSSNTANGMSALSANTTASNNTASGASALGSNSVGNNNTAAGSSSLLGNTTANRNTAIGVDALKTQSFTNGGVAWDSSNTAVGYQALLNNQPTSTANGIGNTAMGVGALSANTTGTNNTALGFGANVSAGGFTNATAIGNSAIVNANNKVRLGNAAVTVIEGQVAYTFPSDRTRKENFRDVDAHAVLEKLRAMNVTTWNYIGHDPREFRHYGPMAQDFHAAFGRDEVGAIGTETTINSGDITAVLMLGLKGLDAQTQADRRTIEAQSAQLKQQAARIAELEIKTAEIAAMKHQLERVSELLKSGR